MFWRIPSLLLVEKQKAIASLRIDANSYQELVGDFIGLYQRITIVSKPSSAEDFDTICEALHTLGPSLSYIGAYSLATFTGELEQAILARDLAEDTKLEERIELFKSSLDIIVENLSTQMS